MPGYIGNKKIKEFYVGNKRVKMIYLGDILKYQYDNIAPDLIVSSSVGTSYDSPTYYQSDNATDYTVEGTVTDADSGVKSVTVNGVNAMIYGNSWSAVLTGLATNTTHTITVVAEDNAGNKSTLNRYLRVEAYYQQAARATGTTVQTSLDATLKSSSICTAMAGNSTAYGIMKSHYSSDMTSYIDSDFNDGLNLLNYKCQLKCYLYKSGNVCSNITNGWSGAWTNSLAGAIKDVYANDNNTLRMVFSRDNGDGLYTDSCYLQTGKSVDISGYTKIYYNITAYSTKGKLYIDTNGTQTQVTSTGTKSVTPKTGVQKLYWKDVPHSNIGEQNVRCSNVWLIP